MGSWIVNKADYPQYYTPEKCNKIGSGDCETFVLLNNAQSKENVLNVLKKIAFGNPDNSHINFGLYHFGTEYLGTNDTAINQRMLYVYIFSGTAALILLLAIINFMNLTTARATTRANRGSQNHWRNSKRDSCSVLY